MSAAIYENVNRITGKILEKGERYQEELLRLRRYFHQHPELSTRERETSVKIKEELDRLGIPWRSIGIPVNYGVIGTIEGGHPGKTILLRADMDALPIQEETELSYTSENDGVMHACGHDCHLAMLLTAAHILTDLRDQLCGTVKLLFQPAEEIGRGAGMMIADGALEGVDACYGSHVWSTLEAGRISVDDRAVMAAGSRFEIFVKGRSGHGAEPHKSVDSLLVTAAIAMNLQSIVSREIDTQEPSVLTIGHMESGSAFNIVPDTGYLEGTTRTFSPEVDEAWESMIRRVSENTATAYRAEAEVKYHYLLGPVINDGSMAALVRGAVEKLGGPALLGHMRPTPVSEDFSEYQKRIPGAFAFIGVGNPAIDAAWPQHSCHYKVDETALRKGAELYAQVAFDFLNQR